MSTTNETDQAPDAHIPSLENSELTNSTRLDDLHWTGIALVALTFLAVIVFLWWGLAASAAPTGGCGGG